MARRLIPRIERFLSRGQDVRTRLRELRSIRDHVSYDRTFGGR